MYKVYNERGRFLGSVWDLSYLEDYCDIDECANCTVIVLDTDASDDYYIETNICYIY